MHKDSRKGMGKSPVKGNGENRNNGPVASISISVTPTTPILSPLPVATSDNLGLV